MNLTRGIELVKGTSRSHFSTTRMKKERQTLIVSVNSNADEDARLQTINAQIGEGWQVVSTLPISGGGMGPGGASEDFLRLQVIVERTVDAANVIVTDQNDHAG